MSVRLILIQKQDDQPADMAIGDSIDVPVGIDRPVLIGRSFDVDVLVRAPSVGRKVVSLFRTPEGVRTEDLHSGGGSRLEVDGVVTDRPSCLLSDGAVLWIGLVAFRVELS